MKRLLNRRILTIVSEEEVGAGSAPAIENEMNEVSNQPIYVAAEEAGTTNNEDQTSVVIEATNRSELEQQLEKMGRDPASPCAVRIPEGTKIISDWAFEDCFNVKKVIFPDSVLIIGEYAFDNCDLTEIVIPSSVLKIHGNSFYGNYLHSITVDKNNPVYDSRDDSNAIIKTKTNALIVGSDNTVIPESVVKIETEAFSQCSTDHVNIPKSIMKIETCAIQGENLQFISVDKGNPVYDSRNDCNAVIETKTDTLIAGCFSTIIPDSVEKIGSYAFSKSYLTYAVIPDYVKAIEESAFSNCHDLSTVIIGRAVKSIERCAFIACDCLETVILLGNEPEGGWKRCLPDDCEIIQL